MKFGEKSERVRAIQKLLNEKGANLVVDGHLGRRTWSELEDFVFRTNLEWDVALSEELVANLLVLGGSSCGSRWYDLRAEPVPFNKGNRFKMMAGKVVRRKRSEITGIVLHQTGIEFGVNTRQLEEAGGDREKALAQRAKGIPTHAVSFNGFFVKNYPLDFYCYHANALNRTTLGLEVDGKYPGLVADRNRAHTVLTNDRLEAARSALAWLVEQGRSEGMPIEFIYAHRQSSSTRRADPGEELWVKVVEEFAIPKLDLTPRYGYVVGSGNPIPVSWADGGTGSY